MSTLAESDPGLGSDATSAPGAAEDRGGLTVAKRVLEKVIVQIATELTGTGDGRRSGLSADTSTRVDVTLTGARAWVALEVGLPYPGPLRTAADTLRNDIDGRVEELTGITVDRLDLQIGWLVPVADRPRTLA